MEADSLGRHVVGECIRRRDAMLLGSYMHEHKGVMALATWDMHDVNCTGVFQSHLV